MVRLKRLPKQRQVRKVRTVKDMSVKEIQDKINDILYGKVSSTVYRDKELLEIIVLRSKKRHFDFLNKRGGHTRWGVIGSWEDYPDEKNFILQIEFKDTPTETRGKYLKKLFGEYNRRVVKEDVLYVRMKPIDISSL